eukprot:XP_001694735.1 predicted protein [Chlamydomonas reinhardtii]
MVPVMEGGRGRSVQRPQAQHVVCRSAVKYGKWPTDMYETHLTDYRNHVARSGREFGIPRNDQEFLDLYYYLRNRTEELGSSTKLPHGNADHIEAGLRLSYRNACW